MGNLPLKTALPLWFILFISVLYRSYSPGGLAKLQAPGGLANISITTEYLWFIVPVMIAKCIALAVKIVQWTVGPSKWEKVEEHARNAIGVARMFELLALHKMVVMIIRQDFDDGWMTSICNWFLIGVEVSLFAVVVISWIY